VPVLYGLCSLLIHWRSGLCKSYVLQTRAEQDQYIRQLEEEGRGQEVYGKGMQLVTPTAAFVAKTANKQSGQKIFINVCTSDKACAPSQYC